MSTTPPTSKVVCELRRLIFSCNRLLQIGSLHRANNQPYRWEINLSTPDKVQLPASASCPDKARYNTADDVTDVTHITTTTTPL